MTEAERKQFINEYCRNVGNIKIRCDDCKFVEDCVDYGWDGCKKFTPKPSEPMTNEEWLRQASTEDVAKWLSKISKFFHECGKRDVYPKTMYEEDWERWLKEKHKE